jgi:hypothetical protein
VTSWSRQLRAVSSRQAPLFCGARYVGDPLILFKMGVARWSIVTVGTVHADAESVMRWWLDPERGTEYLAKAEARGALDLSFTESTEDGVRVRDLRYRTEQGWSFHHRFDVRGGLPVRNGDRFVGEGGDILTARSGWRRFTVTCASVNEFLEQGPDETQVTITHEHTMKGGTWGQRLYRRRNDRIVHDRSFTDMVNRCEAALGATGSSPPTAK